jgi:hypothetical protein
LISSVFCLPLLRRSLLNKKSSEFPILVKNQNQKGGDSPKRVKSRQIPTLSKNATSGFDSATKVHHFSFFDCCHSHWRSHLDRHFWRSLSFFLLFCFLNSSFVTLFNFGKFFFTYYVRFEVFILHWIYPSELDLSNIWLVYVCSWNCVVIWLRTKWHGFSWVLNSSNDMIRILVH